MAAASAVGRAAADTRAETQGNVTLRAGSGTAVVRADAYNRVVSDGTSTSVGLGVGARGSMAATGTSAGSTVARVQVLMTAVTPPS